MKAAWLRELSWPELRHHPWRHLAALVAVMLGVALAFSVQLINQSALSEFAAAVRHGWWRSSGSETPRSRVPMSAFARRVD